MQQQHQLAAILFSDIVGSTAIMQKDEQKAMSINKRYVAVLKQSVSAHGGKILNDFGDGSLCSFTSATEAVRSAMEMQQQFRTDPIVPLRIGLHVGEIYFDDGKAFGDGVNVASRIQSLGIANSILFSGEIYNKLKNQPEFKIVSVGRFRFKNVDEPMEVFALSNEGLNLPDKKKIEGKLETSKTYRTRIIFAAVLLLLGLISFLAYRYYFRGSGFTGKEKSIAVLPFETISSGNENESISDGFTTDIINKLSKLSGLVDVPGWARIKQYKNSKENITDIANDLGVAAILTGTIQKQFNRLHIIAELTDVNTGKTIWRTDVDRNWGDVFALQKEVAEKIAGSLSAKLTVEDQNRIRKQYTRNAEAYYYYNRGRYFWDQRSFATEDSALANYIKAKELDPNYALAYAGLADLYIFNMKGLSQIDAIPLARDYANKALSQDSSLAEAITTIGFIQSVYDYDWKNAKLNLEKAISLDPSYPWAHIFYGNLLQYTGQNTEGGIEEIKKAKDLDPSSVPINWILGRNYYFAGKLDLAEEQLKKTIRMNPGFSLAKTYLAYVLIERREYGQAIEIIDQIPKNGIPTNLEYQDPLLVLAYGLSGNISRAKAAFEKAEKENAFKLHYNVAMAYMGLGNYDLAISELDKSIAEKELIVFFMKVDPKFSPLKNLPRFQELLKKVNLN